MDGQNKLCCHVIVQNGESCCMLSVCCLVSQASGLWCGVFFFVFEEVQWVVCCSSKVVLCLFHSVWWSLRWRTIEPSFPASSFTWAPSSRTSRPWRTKWTVSSSPARRIRWGEEALQLKPHTTKRTAVEPSPLTYSEAKTVCWMEACCGLTAVTRNLNHQTLFTV